MRTLEQIKVKMASVYRGTKKKPVKRFYKDSISKTVKRVESKTVKQKRPKKPKKEVSLTDYRAMWLKSIKSRAKYKGLDFNLTKEDLIIPEFCPVLGIPLELFGNHNNRPSIDRVDSQKGYTKENIVIVSLRANTLKNNATLKEIQAIADFYSQYEY